MSVATVLAVLLAIVTIALVGVVGVGLYLYDYWIRRINRRINKLDGWADVYARDVEFRLEQLEMRERTGRES